MEHTKEKQAAIQQAEIIRDHLLSQKGKADPDTEFLLNHIEALRGIVEVMRMRGNENRFQGAR